MYKGYHRTLHIVNIFSNNLFYYFFIVRIFLLFILSLLFMLFIFIDPNPKNPNIIKQKKTQQVEIVLPTEFSITRSLAFPSFFLKYVFLYVTLELVKYLKAVLFLSVYDLHNNDIQ